MNVGCGLPSSSSFAQGLSLQPLPLKLSVVSSEVLYYSQLPTLSLSKELCLAQTLSEWSLAVMLKDYATNPPPQPFLKSFGIRMYAKVLSQTGSL